MLSDAQQLKHSSMMWFDSEVWIEAGQLDGMKRCLGIWFKVWKKSIISHVLMPRFQTTYYILQAYLLRVLSSSFGKLI